MAGKQTRSKSQCPASADENTQEAVETPAKKTDKKTPEKPYKCILPFLETGLELLFKEKIYQVSVSIGLNSWKMRPIKFVFDSGAGPDLIRADILGPSWLDSVCKREMLDIRSTSDMKLKMSGTKTPFLCMGGSRTRISFDVVNKLVVPVLLETACINRFIKSIHLAQRKIFPHRFSPVPVLTVHEARSEPKIAKLEPSKKSKKNCHCC